MTKIHTRAKRKLAVPPHLNPKRGLTGKKRKRSKTFKSEKSAKEHAENKKIPSEKLILKKVKKGKRFQILVKK